MSDENPVDPVTLALFQDRLDFVARHMGWVMTRTARSPIFSQAHDFSCFVTDPAGTLVSCADGIPIHTGGGGFAVRALLRAFCEDSSEDISEGDVFLLNDPYAAGGNHLPDWVIARPVFAAGTRVAFACNRAHQSDIGGGAAGTYNPEATEIFHEGLRLPPLKLIEGGRVRSDLWRLLLLNSRTPELLDGDLRAMIGSTRIGAERIAALIGEHGVDTGLRCLRGILDHADRRFRGVLAGLADGVYEAEELTHGDGFDDRPIPIRVRLRVEGDTLHVDFTGTHPQLRGFKNSSLANTTSAVYLGLLSFFDPDLPRNEGTFRSVRITAPAGTLVNPNPPAPVTMCTVFPAHEIVHAIWKALAQADPERACAGWGKPIHGVTSSTAGGACPHLAANFEPFVLYHWNALPGAGAVRERDGFDQIGHLIALGGIRIPDLEITEQLYPVRFLRHELRCDGGGAGAHRGGTGVEYEVEVEVPADYSFRGEGVGAPSGYGVAGGGSGAAGEMLLEQGSEQTCAPRYGLARHGPLRLRARSPGGGGWGGALERDPQAVLRDVLDGLVSEDAALELYGVILEAPLVLDAAATAAHRARRRAAERAARDPPRGHRIGSVNPIRELIRQGRVLDLGPLPAPRLSPTATVHQSLQILVRGRRGALVAIEGEKPVGIFTERDVLHLLADGRLATVEARKKLLLREVMSTPPLTIRRQATLYSAIETMAARRHRHLVVVDRHGALKGLLTTNDLVQFLTDQFPEDVVNLPPRLHQKYTSGEGA